MPTPHEFQDVEALVARLKKRRHHLRAWFDNRHKTIEDAVNASVGGNTFRSFGNMRCKPSSVFREWAVRKFKNHRTISSFLQISSRPEYDEWLRKLSLSLNTSWKRKMGERKSLPFGPRRKLPNLLLKRIVLWKGIKPNERTRLLTFLHVPLDRYTLTAIRNCLLEDEGKIGRIPRKPTMGFVKNDEMYMEIQNAIRVVTKKAGVPPIFLDVLAWDLTHKREKR